METEMGDPGAPPLPEQIFFTNETRTSEPTEDNADPPPLAILNYLSHGCYLAQWLFLQSTPSIRYDGVIRVERHNQGASASGDFYVQPGDTPHPDPKAGIPVFPRDNYFFYLRITQLLEHTTSGNSFTLGFERYVYSHSTKAFTKSGDFTAEITFSEPPSSYPPDATYLHGPIKTRSGSIIGHLRLGKVSKYLRKAVVEVDRVSHSEYPGDNGAGIDWKDAYKTVDWDVTAYQSHRNIAERSGESWSDAELHAEMLKSRFSANLDREWRYHLLCVRRLDSTSRGIMYDAYGSDSNNIPREGAAISSHWIIPNSSPWGSVMGQRFGTAAAPYFRTAVHELGHAMGLYHNFADNGFMNVTSRIAESAGTFPDNVQWNFNAADERRLRHLPDPWVRPGMIPFGQPYSSVPISPVDGPVDGLNLSEALSFHVEPLLSTVPIGAPVRVKVTMRNTTETSIEIPPSLSLKSGHVKGYVIGPGGYKKGFQSIMRCVDEKDLQTLGPDDEISHDLTLLRGRDGPLFSTSGLHEIKVHVTWERENIPVGVGGGAPVMIQPSLTESHARAALKTLSTPDVLLTLALGGDHLESGVEALQIALEDETLAPHYAVIEAKRLGRRFGTRSANPSAALKLLKSDTVMSASEVKSMIAIMDGVTDPARSAVDALRKSAKGNKTAEDMVSRLL